MKLKAAGERTVKAGERIVKAGAKSIRGGQGDASIPVQTVADKALGQALPRGTLERPD